MEDFDKEYNGHNVDELVHDYQKNGNTYGEKPRNEDGQIILEVKKGGDYRSEVRIKKNWPFKFPLGTIREYNVKYHILNLAKVNTGRVIIAQCHDGRRGEPAQWWLGIAKEGDDGNSENNELTFMIPTMSDTPNYINKTGLVVQEGDKIDVMIRVKYDFDGFIEVVITKDGTGTGFSRGGQTVFASAPYGGNFKWGIYHRYNETHTKIATTATTGYYEESKEELSEMESMPDPLEVGVDDGLPVMTGWTPTSMRVYLDKDNNQVSRNEASMYIDYDNNRGD